MKSPLLHGFSIDVEDWFQVENYADRIDRDSWNRLESRVQRNMERLLELLDAHSVKATCFTLGWIARKHPELVKRIAAQGHEIASHGEDHRMLYHHTPETFRGTIHDLKHYLEDLTGREVVGYRAPTFTITRKTWWALEVLAESGYRYDSSIFPFQRSRYGVPDAPRVPHTIELSEGHSMVELPLSVVDVAGKTLPISGGGYFRLYPYLFTQWVVRRLENEGRSLIFYMHPWEIDPGQPHVPGVPFKNRVMHRLNLARTIKRVDALLRDFTFGPLVEIADQVSDDAEKQLPERTKRCRIQ